MATRMDLDQDILLLKTDSEQMEVRVCEPGWVTALVPGRPNNRLNVFYHREYLEPVADGRHQVYKLVDGIYEAEFSKDGGLHRIAFEVRSGALGWVTSITLAKKASMDKIASALASKAQA